MEIFWAIILDLLHRPKPGLLPLRPKHSNSPPLQPNNTGRSGNLPLLNIGDPVLGKPVATNHQFAALPYPIRA
ncbi:hypothetical protein [Yersinia sp. 2466 StPb PI]|uniref:hypothetical protein n=1 Tax=Yersinia sp. 2466 StPb PI TaxID=3061648 RepID=UPI00355C3BF1